MPRTFYNANNGTWKMIADDGTVTVKPGPPPSGQAQAPVAIKSAADNQKMQLVNQAANEASTLEPFLPDMAARNHRLSMNPQKAQLFDSVIANNPTGNPHHPEGFGAGLVRTLQNFGLSVAEHVGAIKPDDVTDYQRMKSDGAEVAGAYARQYKRLNQTDLMLSQAQAPGTFGAQTTEAGNAGLINQIHKLNVMALEKSKVYNQWAQDHYGSLDGVDKNGDSLDTAFAKHWQSLPPIKDITPSAGTAIDPSLGAGKVSFTPHADISPTPTAAPAPVGPAAAPAQAPSNLALLMSGARSPANA